MKIYIICSLVLIFSISCKTEVTKKYQGENLCKVLLELVEDDQKYRGNAIVVDPFFAVLDSIQKSEGVENPAHELTEEEQLAYGKRARAIVGKYPKDKDKHLLDSLMILQEKLDNKNTEILIDIIKEVGYPSPDRFPCKKGPSLVFLHSQPQYHKEIKSLITEEYRNGRLDEFVYGLILRHIGGRKENDLEKVIEENEINFSVD